MLYMLTTDNERLSAQIPLALNDSGNISTQISLEPVHQEVVRQP